MSDKTIRSIICDGCGSELIVDSCYPADYSLELKAINTGRNTSGIEFAVMVYPPLESTKHFCGKKCLAVWVDENT